MELTITFEFGEDVKNGRTYERFFQIDFHKNVVNLKRVYHLQPDEISISGEKDFTSIPVQEKEIDLISFLRNYSLLPSITFWKLHYELHECRSKRSLQDNFAFFISSLFIREEIRAKSILIEMKGQGLPLSTYRIFNQAVQEITG
ncbi:MAG: hypothetical protein MUF42_00880 [Cytophagaceae bacterium]|nr:hypothetical protein [Cytophagaceae bacterium]